MWKLDKLGVLRFALALYYCKRGHPFIVGRRCIGHLLDVHVMTASFQVECHPSEDTLVSKAREHDAPK